MDILEFVTEQAYIMIPALWVMGYVIKNTKLIKDKFIPLSLLVVSVAFSPILLGGYTAENIVQAVLVAGGAVFADQLIKQSGKDE